MPPPSLKPKLMLSDAPTLNDLARQCAPWDALEHLIQELNGCDRSVQHIRLTLEAVRQCVDAEVVFWCSESPGEGLEIAGEQDLSPEWCRQFTRRLLAETPGVDGQMIRSNLPVSPSRTSPSPRSAALVRLSKSRSTWMVALSFRADHCFDLADVKVMSLARQLLLHQRRQLDVRERLKETISSLLNCLTLMIEMKMPYGYGHSGRVAEIAACIAQHMRLPAEFVSDVYFAGLLHDIGSIDLPEGLLCRPGKLSQEEFERIKQCPLTADCILAGVRPLQRLRSAIRHHHERHDGEGYPDRLAGEDIPLMARILSVAESCDAMMSARPYRPALPTTHVEVILAEGAGTQWDPQVVAHFMACRTDLYRICKGERRSSMGPAVERAVEGWNMESSKSGFHERQRTVKVACRETVTHRQE